MSSYYYPPVPMLDSGIYDEIGDREGMYCGTCEDNGIPQGIIPEEVEVTRRGHRLFYTCPLCGTDQETTCG